MYSCAELRASFLKFFQEHGHTVVASSSLVPANDRSLLFTNAGMVQFKETFLGLEKRNYTRATSAQRCVRAGGKHNDLENVGYTARHHTFFEMLGNFSFGDYFKRDAIKFAWQYLTEVLKLPPERLWVTVYEKDDEAADIWLKEMKVDAQRFGRIGEKDNFWSMGDTGPCGPCSEIFYDHGADIPGGPPGSADEDGDRYIEIWNLVFMQYERKVDGSLEPLPKPSVDTGMGLERLAAIMQGVHNNYDIDLFQSLIKAAAKLTHVKDLQNNSLRVISDHIRSSAFLICDGVIPSNEDRGYVLRRIIRRAVRHGYELGMREPFFYKLVDTLEQEMGPAYPELSKNKKQIKDELLREEEQFARTIENGMKVLERSIRDIRGKVIPGDVVFDLWNTYGFPADLTADMARGRGLEIDWDTYKTAELKQKKDSGSGTFENEVNIKPEVDAEFIGYSHLDGESKITQLVLGEQSVDSASAGSDVIVFLDKTPFYAESGGQVGDQGVIRTKNAEIEVLSTKRFYSHLGKIRKGQIKVGDQIVAQVNEELRVSTARNHSATHLLHAALRKVLGEHVNQKGSLVDAERLRFDFSHPQPVSQAELLRIENLVNEQIRHNLEVQTKVMDLENALQSGAMALFDEKYDAQVRVLSMGDFSIELCGGTHVKRTGDIGLFKITQETSSASGIRRIEAVTGQRAIDWLNWSQQQLWTLSDLLKDRPERLQQKLTQNLDKIRNLEKEIESLKARMASKQGEQLTDHVVQVEGVNVLAARIDDPNPKALRDTMDRLKDRLSEAAIVLGAVDGDKVRLVAGVTSDLTKRLKAGNLVNEVAMLVGGKGGGRPDLAQAGGNEPESLQKALDSVPDLVKAQLKS